MTALFVYTTLPVVVVLIKSLAEGTLRAELSIANTRQVILMTLVVGVGTWFVWAQGPWILRRSARRAADPWRLRPHEIEIEAEVVERIDAVAIGRPNAPIGGQMRFRYRIDGKVVNHRISVTDEHFHRHSVGSTARLALDRRRQRRRIRVLDEAPEAFR
ncbi:MAG: hypothetical protein AAF561_08235 [Planctomycetota bacterium]